MPDKGRAANPTLQVLPSQFHTVPPRPFDPRACRPPYTCPFFSSAAKSPIHLLLCSPPPMHLLFHTWLLKILTLPALLQALAAPAAFSSQRAALFIPNPANHVSAKLQAFCGCCHGACTAAVSVAPQPRTSPCNAPPAHHTRPSPAFVLLWSWGAAHPSFVTFLSPCLAPRCSSSHRVLLVHHPRTITQSCVHTST